MPQITVSFPMDVADDEDFTVLNLKTMIENQMRRLLPCSSHLLVTDDGVVMSDHRSMTDYPFQDLDEILDAYEKGDKFYLYTGMRPSQNMHLGDLIPLMFSRYLQDAFKVPLVIQLTDDEKCMLENLTVEESKRLAWESAKDIIACGFDIKNTFIFSDFRYVGGAFYENMVKVGNCITYNKAVDMFGFTGEDHIGKVSFRPVQAVPTFRTSFPLLFSGQENLRCLISCVIDQDPIFRMTRNVAPRLGYLKPALIESSFIPALQAETEKMSASDPNTAIYLTDSAKAIMSKMDDPFKYISFFLEDDEYDYITNEHMFMSTTQVKDRLIQTLSQIVEAHCIARAAVTDEVVEAFMKVRHLPQMPD